MKELHPEREFSNFLSRIQDRGRTMLLPALLQVQEIFGYIPREKAEQIGAALSVPLADIAGLIDFYSILKTTKNGSPHISVCTSPVCAAKGAGDLIADIQNNLPAGADLEHVACLGLCDHSPAVLIDDTQIGHATVERIFSPPGGVKSSLFGDSRMITQWCNEEVDHSLEFFLECGGFEGLEVALKIEPDHVIQAVKDSGLKGRGGAGFPTGLKWASAAQQQTQPKYLVCNQDESEPGTFKDRALLLGDPFKIIEGLIIAGYAIGARQAYFYIRGEYPQARKTIESAIHECKEAGYLGKNILDKGFDFDIEVRSGGGAYICGEETALFESIEGKRGFPRIKPPFPTTEGLFGKPTVINNVETIANIPLIFQIGPDEYKKLGSEIVTGPRLLSVSGDIKNPGVYEISEPITLKSLIYDLAGGMQNEKSPAFVLLGGAAGKFVSPENLDILLAEENLRKIGHSLGSGAVMVFGNHNDLPLVLTSLAEFFAHESCGKCYPCQLGTQRQSEIISRWSYGKMLPGDSDRLQDVGWTMKDSSICGLGQTASQAILSALDLWPELFAEEEIS